MLAATFAQQRGTMSYLPYNKRQYNQVQESMFQIDVQENAHNEP
jgi:hypothetical protein